MGNWCSKMRCAYKKIQEGHTPTRNLTQDQIERLEEIDFKWDLANKTTFDQRCHDLKIFKSEFGHCNVSHNYSADPSLGNWCNAMRYTYKKIQQGQKTPKGNLTQDQIERLEEIGFKWDLANKTAFEQRCRDLEISKREFGHCNVPYRYLVNPSLGNWCNAMRYAYKKIRQGQTPKGNLTQDQIKRLEEIAFKWDLANTTAFEQHCHDLEISKREFGHCNVPYVLGESIIGDVVQ